MERIFGHRVKKFFLFLASYIIAALIAGVINGFVMDNISDGDLIGFIILLGGLIFFLSGFGWPISIFPQLSFLGMLGPFVYLGVIAYAVIIKNIRASKISYLIFILLLILNIGGCTIGIADIEGYYIPVP